VATLKTPNGNVTRYVIDLMPLDDSRKIKLDERGIKIRAGRFSTRIRTPFFAFFLTLARRFFAAFTIAALPAADKTRLFTPTTLRSWKYRENRVRGVCARRPGRRRSKVPSSGLLDGGEQLRGSDRLCV
jgi:hypothetical protein